MPFVFVYERLFPDDKPERVRQWRIFVSQIIVALVVVSLFVIASMFIGIPRLGQLVWAADVSKEVEKAQQTIREDVAELRKEVQGQNKKVDTLSRLVYRQTLEGLAAQYRSYKIRRCRSIDPIERDYLLREMDRVQEEYKTLKGSQYEAPLCADL